MSKVLDDLKALGLKYGEDVVVDVIDTVLEPALRGVIESSENKFDDMVLPLLPLLLSEAKKLAEGIDKTDNPGYAVPADPSGAV